MPGPKKVRRPPPPPVDVNGRPIDRYTRVEHLPEYVHARELAQFLGLSLPRAYELIAGGRLPTIAFCGRRYVSRAGLEALGIQATDAARSAMAAARAEDVE